MYDVSHMLYLYLLYVFFYRKLSCEKLTKFSPQLIANSLAFMNCVAGSEEQKELEALERLAARAALLETAKPLPPGESLQFRSHFGSILNNSMLLSFLSFM